MKFLSSVALLFCFTIAPFVHADDASKRAKTEELLQVTKVNQLMDQMTQQMTTRMKSMAAQQTANRNVNPVQQKTIDDYIQQIQSITRGAIAWDKVKGPITQNYLETYTEKELDDILAFYRSPAGQALINKSPQLMAKTMQLVQNQMNEVQPQIRQANEDFTRKMKEIGPIAPTPAPAAPAAPAAKP